MDVRAAFRLRRLTPLSLLIAAGCTLLTAIPPQVQVQDVTLRRVGLLDQVLAVQVCVTNPNASALDFRAVRVGLDLEGTAFAEGESATAVSLPPRSSTLVPFQVTTTARNLGPQLLGVLRAGGLDYRVHGTVTLTGALALSLPFSQRGRLSLLAAEQGALADAAMPGATACGSAPR